MPDNLFFPKNIVIPVDIEEKYSNKEKCSWTSLMPVVKFFVTNMSVATVHFVYVIPNFGMYMVEDYLPNNWVKDRKKECHLKITNLIKEYLPSDIEYNIKISRGAIYDEVINYSNSVNADLIIVPAVGSEYEKKDYMLGPNASKIARHADVSVYLIRS